jgi:RHS repeat-associated protein
VATVTRGDWSGAETRVRGINLAVETASGLEDEASLGPHSGIGYTYGETASARANQYNGRVSDTGTSFIDYGARMYWPQIGRFISADTAGPDLANPASFNRYAYVQNNPYKYVDPTGHSPVPVIDAMFMLYDIASYAYNASTGNQAAANVDLMAFGVDAAFALVPGPPGMGLAVRAGEHASTEILLHASSEEAARALVKGQQAANLARFEKKLRSCQQVQGRRPSMTFREGERRSRLRCPARCLAQRPSMRSRSTRLARLSSTRRPRSLRRATSCT